MRAYLRQHRWARVLLTGLVIITFPVWCAPVGITFVGAMVLLAMYRVATSAWHDASKLVDWCLK